MKNDLSVRCAFLVRLGGVSPARFSRAESDES